MEVMDRRLICTAMWVGVTVTLGTSKDANLWIPGHQLQQKTTCVGTNWMPVGPSPFRILISREYLSIEQTDFPDSVMLSAKLSITATPS